uniref:basement membrane-specific heparan sulfate proteoglycan core protein-like n=1 Tax=Scatophagus argus TaxID=75038 RepID=UPI001ED7CE39|nr:basement membrane-specific heparan sulfate proteoglycan core protein-like [Scatophagus argus]
MLSFYLLLTFTLGRCTDDVIFDMKTVGVGDDVTLTCTRQESKDAAALFWIRLVSGNLPELLGGTFAFDYEDVNEAPRITAKQGPGTFLLHIKETKRSDTGVYYCVKVHQVDMKFLNGTFLRIKGSEPDITAVIQEPPSDSVHPGDSVTLQCSVLSDPEDKTCPGGPSVFWFKAGSDESHPSVIYTHGDSGDGCDKSPEAHAPQKCVYSFSKNVSSSDDGTYYCAVATCGEILFGNGTKLDTEAPNTQEANTVLLLLCAALALSLIVITCLIYTIKKTSCGCCKAQIASGDQQSQQRDENSLVYSAPTVTKSKAAKSGKRNVKTTEGGIIYSDVRTFVSAS